MLCRPLLARAGSAGRRVVTGVADLLAPPRCLACRARATPPWCANCAADVAPLRDGCRRCGAARRPGHPCWPAGAPIDTTVAAYDYRGPVAAAVVTAKVGGAHAGWWPLAHRLAARVAEHAPEVDAVTWVTTPPGRRRRRGLDHARRLAAVVAAVLEAPLVATLDARMTPGGADRYRAVGPLPGTHLLLVDDVLTTGVTAVGAAAALRAAGAGEIHLAVLARAGPHPLASPGPDPAAGPMAAVDAAEQRRPPRRGAPHTGRAEPDREG